MYLSFLNKTELVKLLKTRKQQEAFNFTNSKAGEKTC